MQFFEQLRVAIDIREIFDCGLVANCIMAWEKKHAAASGLDFKYISDLKVRLVTL